MANMIFHTSCMPTSIQYLTQSLISRSNRKDKNNSLAPGTSAEHILHSDTGTEFASNQWPMCKTMTKISEKQLKQLPRRYTSRLPQTIYFYLSCESGSQSILVALTIYNRDRPHHLSAQIHLLKEQIKWRCTHAPYCSDTTQSSMKLQSQVKPITLASNTKPSQ